MADLDRTDLAHVKPTGDSFDDPGRGEEEGVRNFDNVSESAAARLSASASQSFQPRAAMRQTGIWNSAQ